jgi:hypothetical protein
MQLQISFLKLINNNNNNNSTYSTTTTTTAATTTTTTTTTTTNFTTNDSYNCLSTRIVSLPRREPPVRSDKQIGLSEDSLGFAGKKKLLSVSEIKLLASGLWAATLPTEPTQISTTLT